MYGIQVVFDQNPYGIIAAFDDIFLARNISFMLTNHSLFDSLSKSIRFSENPYAEEGDESVSPIYLDELASEEAIMYFRVIELESSYETPNVNIIIQSNLLENEYQPCKFKYTSMALTNREASGFYGIVSYNAEKNESVGMVLTAEAINTQVPDIRNGDNIANQFEVNYCHTDIIDSNGSENLINRQKVNIDQIDEERSDVDVVIFYHNEPFYFKMSKKNQDNEDALDNRTIMKKVYPTIVI